MRFNVHGFDQKMAIEFGLSNDELLILRHFEDFVYSGKMDHFYEDGYIFYWVNYEKFLNDLPILNINKKRLGEIMIHNLGERPFDLDERIETFSEKTKIKFAKRKYLGILKSKTLKNSDIGVRSYFSFTKKFYELKLDITDSDLDINNHVVKIPLGCGKNTTTPVVKIPQPLEYFYYNKDYSIKDYSINDINTYSLVEQTEGKEIHKRIIDYLNEKADKSFKSTTKKTRDLINARLKEGFVEEDFYKAIDNKVHAWLEYAKMNVYLRPETLFGNKFESYLNEVPRMAKNGNESVKQNKEVSKNKFANFEQTFTQYSNKELDEIIKKSQKAKFEK
ncbi:conserved phage family protein [Clostridioides difficile CD160]|nr:conserved phage family protein [Clostridioides difficile CD160]